MRAVRFTMGGVVAHVLWPDFEDACLYQCAKKLRVCAIITRSQADFERSSIPIYDCAELFVRLKDAHGLVYEEIEW